MATAVGIMDAPVVDANTDVIVVADPAARTLRWVPRDLWCEGIANRVNKAFALSGHEGLRAALAELGLSVGSSVCVGRRAAELALEGLTIEVPVRERMEFWYPRLPNTPIEDGRKRVAFEPPSERLSGERIHQWIGARYRIDKPGSDFDRIDRQQLLAFVLLERGFDFGRALELEHAVSVSSPDALSELSRVESSWRLETFARDAVHAEIDGKQVLTRPTAPPHS